MTLRHLNISLLLALLVMMMPAKAQTAGGGEEESALPIEEKMVLLEKLQDFIDDTNNLCDYIDGSQAAQLNSLKRFAQIIDVRWENFYATEQETIAKDDSLMTLVADYSQAMQMVNDSIDARDKILKLTAQFVIAEKTIRDNVKKYEDMQKKATALALIPQTAAKLDELKAQEQLIFEDLTKLYNDAKEAHNKNASLEKRFTALETDYVKIKSMSAKIQEAVYQSPIQRAKDYLMSLACVAILLMFVTFLTMMLNSARKAYKQAQEVKKLMKKQDEDIPTI